MNLNIWHNVMMKNKINITDLQIIELQEAKLRLCYIEAEFDGDFWEAHEEAFQEIYGYQIKQLKDKYL